MIESFAARAGGFQSNGKLFFGFGLADEFAKTSGAELQLEGAFVLGAYSGDEPVGIRVWNVFLRRHLAGILNGSLPGERAAGKGPT